jgi:hypothetical protein
MFDNYKPKQRKNYYVPKLDRPTYTELDKSEWKVSAITQKAVNAIQKATLRTGGTKEALIRMVVDERDMHLFTPNVENRLLAMFRNLYDCVVMVESYSPELDGRTKRNALLKRAQKEHNKKEKEHERNSAID